VSVRDNFTKRAGGLTMKEQIEAARKEWRDPTIRRERLEGLSKLRGCLSEEDGELFERVLKEGRRIESGPHASFD
jgi:hypothetical protein